MLLKQTLRSSRKMKDNYYVWELIDEISVKIPKHVGCVFSVCSSSASFYFTLERLQHHLLMDQYTHRWQEGWRVNIMAKFWDRGETSFLSISERVEQYLHSRSEFGRDAQILKRSKKMLKVGLSVNEEQNLTSSLLSDTRLFLWKKSKDSEKTKNIGERINRLEGKCFISYL